ncbi:hypothetical protein Taro_023283 [Colocasia esculenta]|uniref:Uncharacterized protein n=1 Tax=Colocasia esculenta TaxID=4460 RepID=A0A843VAX6_COLES|nr:hypothetical protein [Colocasia esculenta]
MDLQLCVQMLKAKQSQNKRKRSQKVVNHVTCRQNTMLLSTDLTDMVQMLKAKLSQNKRKRSQKVVNHVTYRQTTMLLSTDLTDMVSQKSSKLRLQPSVNKCPSTVDRCH